MDDKGKGTICLLPKLKGIGGPASFHARFSEVARRRGYTVHNDPEAEDMDVIMVIGGTRHLDLLWRAKRRGVRIVQRLDGMNWIHRKRWTGPYHFFRSEVNNVIMEVVRRIFADEIIYQSKFVVRRWNDVFGQLRKKTHQIYNGVDLVDFNPMGDHHRPENHIRLLVVEGRLRGGHCFASCAISRI